LRLAQSPPDNNVLVRSGTNVVSIADAISLKPQEWLFDSILHYFTNQMKRAFKIKSSVLGFFPCVLTLLFNEGTFSYRNVKTWATNKLKPSKTPINEIKTMVFFYNKSRMHWTAYVIFQDLKVI
jgi:Ulp1 family protease